MLSAKALAAPPASPPAPAAGGRRRWQALCLALLLVYAAAYGTSLIQVGEDLYGARFLDSPRFRLAAACLPLSAAAFSATAWLATTAFQPLSCAAIWGVLLVTNRLFMSYSNGVDFEDHG